MRVGRARRAAQQKLRHDLLFPSRKPAGIKEKRHPIQRAGEQPRFRRLGIAEPSLTKEREIDCPKDAGDVTNQTDGRLASERIGPSEDG